MALAVVMPGLAVDDRAFGLAVYVDLVDRYQLAHLVFARRDRPLAFVVVGYPILVEAGKLDGCQRMFCEHLRFDELRRVGKAVPAHRVLIGVERRRQCVRALVGRTAGEHQRTYWDESGQDTAHTAFPRAA